MNRLGESRELPMGRFVWRNLWRSVWDIFRVTGAVQTLIFAKYLTKSRQGSVKADASESDTSVESEAARMRFTILSKALSPSPAVEPPSWSISKVVTAASSV